MQLLGDPDGDANYADVLDVQPTRVARQVKIFCDKLYSDLFSVSVAVNGKSTLSVNHSKYQLISYAQGKEKMKAVLKDVSNQSILTIVYRKPKD